MASFLEEFLVTLGFKVDKDSLAKFQHSVLVAQRGIIGIGQTAARVALTMTEGITEAAVQVKKVYQIADRVGTNVTGVKALENALERVGGRAENAGGMLLSLHKKFTSLRGLPGAIQRNFGVNVKDQNGEWRDMVDIIADLSDAAKKMKPEVARAKLETVGLAGYFDTMMHPDFSKQIRANRKRMDQLGKDLDKNAKKAEHLANTVESIWSTIQTGTQNEFIKFLELTEIDKWLEEWEQKLPTVLSNFFGELNKYLDMWKKGILGAFVADQVGKAIEGKAKQIGDDAAAGKYVPEDIFQNENVRAIWEKVYGKKAEDTGQTYDPTDTGDDEDQARKMLQDFVENQKKTPAPAPKPEERKAAAQPAPASQPKTDGNPTGADAKRNLKLTAQYYGYIPKKIDDLGKKLEKIEENTRPGLDLSARDQALQRIKETVSASPDVAFRGPGPHGLNERTAAKYQKLRELVKKEFGNDYDIDITSGFRSFAEQNALHAQGRPGGPAGPIVTNAKGGQSMHNYGAAFDIHLTKGGKRVSGFYNDRETQKKIGELGEKAELTWGGSGRFGFYDGTHFQDTVPLRQLRMERDARVLAKKGLPTVRNFRTNFQGIPARQMQMLRADAAAASGAAPVHPGNKTDVKINQTINFNGSADPAKVGPVIKKANEDNRKILNRSLGTPPVK